MKNLLSVIAFFACLSTFAGTSGSDILITIDTTRVTADEFMRIYNKNSSISVEEKKSIDDYLDLFINYKLKVVEAINQGYDTLSSFKKEMEGYADQLAKPYLDDDEILDSYVKESYERYKKEINASHIIIRLDPNSSPKDTVEAYNKLMEMREAYLNGDSFEKIIKDNSPNPQQEIGGNLGWFSAMRMVYPFEIAAYNTPEGEVSMPIRTQFGYHLIKIEDIRDNRGEANISHIMAMFPRQNPNDLEIETSKNKIMSAYEALQKGEAWDSVVIKYSEHRSTRTKGGKLGWVKSGMIPDSIMAVSFSLEKGSYSEPFQSEFGWHIVKLEDSRPIPSYEEYKKENQNKIKQSRDVQQLSQKQHLANIRKKHGFLYNSKELMTALSGANASWLDSTWAPTEEMNKTVAFKIGDEEYSQADVIIYLIERKIISKHPTPEVTYRASVEAMINQKLLKYERKMLPAMYPEYKALLDEYYDGILLFNLTEDMVWNKAVEDTTGIETFYNSIDEKYMWEKRIVMAKYTYADSTLTDKILKFAKKRSKDDLNNIDFCTLVCANDSLPSCVKFEILKYEKGDNSVADAMAWKRNKYLTSKDRDNYVIYFVEEVLPAQTKTLKDARGLYTADYQSYLEQKWIEELRNKYSITVNEDVLTSLKKQN